MRRLLLLVMVVVGLGYTLLTCLAQVGPGERGVVKRFGKVVQTVGPGLYVGLPWGIDRVERVNVDRVRRVVVGFTTADSDDLGLTVPAGQLLTGDHNLVNAQMAVDYVVNEKEVELFALYGDQADGLVARAAENALTEWVAGRDVDEVLLRGKQILPFWLKDETQKRIADYKLGIRIQTVSVNDIAAPRQVKDAFEAVARAQTEIATATHAANQSAEARWSEAQSAKFSLEKKAATYADNARSLAQQEAGTWRDLLAKLQPLREQDPNYLATLWWTEMTTIYNQMKAGERLDVLDSRLGRTLDILQSPQGPRRK